MSHACTVSSSSSEREISWLNTKGKSMEGIFGRHATGFTFPSPEPVRFAPLFTHDRGGLQVCRFSSWTCDWNRKISAAVTNQHNRPAELIVATAQPRVRQQCSTRQLNYITYLQLFYHVCCSFHNIFQLVGALWGTALSFQCRCPIESGASEANLQSSTGQN